MTDQKPIVTEFRPLASRFFLRLFFYFVWAEVLDLIGAVVLRVLVSKVIYPDIPPPDVWMLWLYLSLVSFFSLVVSAPFLYNQAILVVSGQTVTGPAYRWGPLRTRATTALGNIDLVKSRKRSHWWKFEQTLEPRDGMESLYTKKIYIDAFVYGAGQVKQILETIRGIDRG